MYSIERVTCTYTRTCKTINTTFYFTFEQPRAESYAHVFSASCQARWNIGAHCALTVLSRVLHLLYPGADATETVLVEQFKPTHT